MFYSALKMPSSQWKSSVTWLVVKEKPFQTVCCTMLATYEGQGSTGSSSGVGSLPWWTPLVYPLSSSHTVQLISSGQSWCPDDPDSSTRRSRAVIENPAIADWFFHHRFQKFIDAFYVGVLGVTDYWMRFEWQHRGSPHVHGLAWLPDTPDVEEILASSEDGDDTAKEELIVMWTALSPPLTLQFPQQRTPTI